MMNENENNNNNNIENEKSKNFYSQIIYLNKEKDKNFKNLKNFTKNDENLVQSNDEILFQINKMSYFEVKSRKYKYFGFGKIKLSKNNSDDYINIIFHDSSFQLRFQGLISIKLSSLSIDNNKMNCIVIKKIIGIIYYINDIGETYNEKLITDIHLYFRNGDDVDNFINSVLHI